MRLRILGLSLLLATVGSAGFAQQRHDYWLVGRANDDSTLQFIDAASIEGSAESTRRARTMSFNSDQASQLPGTHMVALQEFNCGTRQSRWLQLTYYDDKDRPVPDMSVDEPQDWRHPIPGSMGDTVLQFVCAGEAVRSAVASRISPKYGPASFSQAYFKHVAGQLTTAKPQ